MIKIVYKKRTFIAEQVVAVLLGSIIGVLRSPVTTVRIFRLSTMASSPTAISTASTGCVQFGLFNYLSI